MVAIDFTGRAFSVLLQNLFIEDQFTKTKSSGSNNDMLMARE